MCHQGEVSLYVMRYGAEVEIGADEFPDFYMVSVPLAGHGVVVVDRQEALSAPNVVSPRQQFWMHKSAERTTLVVRIERRAVEKALHELLGEPPDSLVRFTAPIETRNNQARQWLTLVRAMAGPANDGLLARSPLAAGHFEQLVVHGLLGFQPHSWSAALDQQTRDRYEPPQCLRRAMSYCQEHAEQPISVGDLASVAGVSVRTLQEHFRVHAQTTPLGYLRQVRLERVRRDLIAAARCGEPVTVTDVALRWGFVHLSRFAALYRDAFGHLPSESLSIERGARSTFCG